MSNGNQGPTVLHNQISSKLALYTKATLMEEILRNPGLQHLAEEVFWNLDVEDLKICAHINQSCKQILQHPIFCLRKFEHLSKENQND